MVGGGRGGMALNLFVGNITLSADGQRLAGSSRDGAVRVWNMATGKEVASLAGNGLRSNSRLALSPDGKLLAVAGNDGSLRLWDVAANAQLRTLGPAPAAGGVRGFPYRLEFGPDGKTFFQAGIDFNAGNARTTATIWEVPA